MDADLFSSPGNFVLHPTISSLALEFSDGMFFGRKDKSVFETFLKFTSEEMTHAILTELHFQEVLYVIK